MCCIKKYLWISIGIIALIVLAVILNDYFKENHSLTEDNITKKENIARFELKADEIFSEDANTLFELRKYVFDVPIVTLVSGLYSGINIKFCKTDQKGNNFYLEIKLPSANNFKINLQNNDSVYVEPSNFPIILSQDYIKEVTDSFNEQKALTYIRILKEIRISKNTYQQEAILFDYFEVSINKLSFEDNKTSMDIDFKAMIKNKFKATYDACYVAEGNLNISNIKFGRMIVD